MFRPLQKCLNITLYYIIHQFVCVCLCQFDSGTDSIEGVLAAGKPAISQNNESRLYWTPAPPKLDVAPAKVKDILFPEYQVTRHFLHNLLISLFLY